MDYFFSILIPTNQMTIIELISVIAFKKDVPYLQNNSDLSFLKTLSFLQLHSNWISGIRYVDEEKKKFEITFSIAIFKEINTKEEFDFLQSINKKYR